MLILIPFMSWILFIGLVVLTFFGFIWALYVYLIISCTIIGYTYMIDFGAKRKIKETFHILTTPEMEKYSAFLMFPFASKILSIILNSIRWTGIIMVIAIFTIEGISSYFAIIPTLIFFFCGSLSVNLDPIFFLSHAIRNGQDGFIEELEMLKYYVSITH